MKSRYLAALTALMLALAACGGDDTVEEPDPAQEPAEEPDETDETDEEPTETDEASAEQEAADGLDCDSVEMMVPYAPGGGSDLQVRRLEGPVSESLGVNTNIVYREGAEGAVAWTALMDAEPDGCTVANVVIPNIILAAEQEGAPFEAEDFEYLAFTEGAPNGLVVANDSEYETIEEFIEAARENPGQLTIGGSGSQGQLTAEQIMEAADIDITYVPLEGGVGDTLPQVQGGHIDGALFSSSHAVNNSDTIRALALAGTETSPALEGVPTFEDAGYPGVTVATTWGILAPPGTPDDIVALWNDAITQAVESDEINEALIDGGLTPITASPEETEELLAEYLETFSGQG